MDILKKLRASKLHNFYTNDKSYLGLSILIILFATIVISSFTNDVLFHSTAEIFSCIISFGVFVIVLNTYSMSKNNFLVLLGIGHLFTAVLGMIHVFAYPGLSIISNINNYNVSMQLWISSTYIEAFTCLVSTILLYKRINKFRINLTFIAYFCITAFILFTIFNINLFPTCYDNGQTQFKIISEYIISFIFVLVFILYFKLRKNMDFQLFFYMECFVITKIITEVLLSVFTNTNDTVYIISHILKVIYNIFIYKAVIELALKRPFAVVFRELDKFNNELKIANIRLQEESKQREYFEEMFIRNDHFYDLIINNSSDAITVVSEGKYIFVNNRALELFGVNNSSELIGAEASKFNHTNYSDLLARNVTKVNTITTNSCSTEHHIQRLDGTKIYVVDTCSHILFRGKPAYISLLKNISSLKQIDKLESHIKESEKIINEAREFNKQITEFFVNISHELKTPLNVILGAIQLLELPNHDSVSKLNEFKSKRYLKTMKQNCFRLLRIVDNLIDLSKFDSGFSSLNLCNHNIVSLIEDITLSVADYIEEKGVELIFDTETEEKIMAIDTAKVDRILLNLLSNAVKFTNKGDHIFVTLEDKHESVIVSVKDTGTGIPEDKLDIIFERFGQVDKTLSRNNEGSGLGLCLVKSLVTLHGGTINVKSIVGEGSEFIIELPARIIEEKEIEQNCINQSSVEKISVEFSDIYSI